VAASPRSTYPTGAVKPPIVPGHDNLPGYNSNIGYFGVSAAAPIRVYPAQESNVG
jgi:hypothetical protein